MESQLFEYVKERAQIITTAESSKQETKDAAQTWLDAVARIKPLLLIDSISDPFQFMESFYFRPKDRHAPNFSPRAQ